MKKTAKIWVGIGAFVLAGSGGLAAPAAATGKTFENTPSVKSLDKNKLMSSSSLIHVAQGGEGGEGGDEGGEGGEGGEAGINVAATKSDPVEYNIALQVIAAHYHAGLAAYEGKETEAGTQMFAHGLAEIYIPMEDVFKELGVKGLRESMEAAVDAGASNKPAPEVRKVVENVLKAVAAAEKAGPKSSLPAIAVKAKVMADMLDRAAKQYGVSLNDKELEPYLDGLGFAATARMQAKEVLPQLQKADKKKAAAIKTALDMANAAFPGINRPKTAKVKPGDFLAAASAAQLAVANW